MPFRRFAKKLYITASALTAAGLLLFLLLRPGTEGDTQTLVRGSFHALACIRAGEWKACPGVEPFAIYQYVPAVLLAALGMSANAIMHFLAYLSWVVFLLSFYEVGRALRPRGPQLVWAGFLVLASGFGMRYLNLSSGEMLAAYLTLAFVSSLLSGRSLAACCAFAFAATITKETAFPFLLLWVFVVVFFVPDARRTVREGLRVALAIVVGVAVNFAFNGFRFGTFKNLQYMQPWEFVTDPHTRLSYFLAEWFSPAGGLWIFWTSFCVLVTAGLALAWRSRNWRHAVPALAIGATLAGMTLGYSGWYAPMGGFSWGARFYVPWVPAITLFMLWVYAREFRKLFRAWTARPAAFWGLSGVLAIAAFPQYAFLMRMSLIGHILQPAACMGVPAASVNSCIFWQPWPWGIVSFFNPLPRLDLFCLAAFMSSWVMAMAWRIKQLNTLPQEAHSDTREDERNSHVQTVQF